MITFKNSPITTNTIIFSGGEVHVQLENFPFHTPSEINIRADILNSNDLIELQLTCNALRNYYLDFLHINVEIPYFPYARQDRVCATGQAFSLREAAKTINDMNFNSVTSWDVHSDVTLDLVKNMNNISQKYIIQGSPDLIECIGRENTFILSPDKGALLKTLEIKDHFDFKGLLIGSKVRDPETGNITGTKIDFNGCDIEGATIFMADDICDGGRTFIELAKMIKVHGNPAKIILYVTHGIFSKGLAPFVGHIDEIHTTDSMDNSNIKEEIPINIINYKGVI